eukprot:c14588_g1_i1.p1 GENE.c14588_g1_i1~~c14588_g1_i1.p1  ORF type:complete len:847 (+),score=204.30 c14588_g1_i1:51-2543(+)
MASLLVFAFVAGVVCQEIHTEQPAIVHDVQKEESGTILVKEYLIDASVEDIQWGGKTSKVVFVRSSVGTIYRSSNHGKTWENQMEKLRGSLVAEKEGQKGVAQVIISDADRDYVFFQGYGQTHWVTRDGGESYDMLAGAFPVKQVVLHPTNPEWVLASKWSAGCQKVEAVQNCSVEAHLSTDFGRSWSFLEAYVVQFAWGRASFPEEIFMVRYEKPEGNQRFGAWDKNADFFRSTDLWKTNSKMIPHGNRFLLLGSFLFVAAVNPDKANEVQIVVAKEDSMVYEVGRLPFELREHSYTILDTSEGAVFLHVNHGEYNTPYGTIYLSDADGWRYSLSLKNNRRDTRGRCDFEKVKGLDGIYIANYVENPEFVDNWAEKEHVVTVMTFDKGGRWSRIKAPQHDSAGKETDCSLEDGCSLHLHGVTDEWGPFYSTNSALGLIMATGNTGRFLDMHGGSVNTYFSRDGGQSWFEVRKGSHIYEFGDHGGLMVMAKDREQTNEVLYSWNEGISWKTLPLPDMSDVDNIITEPNSTSPSFVLYGSRGGVGVLTFLDFSTLHVKQCQGIEAAGRAQSSYELWSPTDGMSRCLLGRQVQYTRRKRAEECYNGEVYERQSFVSNCPCTEESFECDAGFERQGLDGPCLPLRAITTDAPDPCPPGSKYTIPNGYRRVAGDTCDLDQGLNRLPAELRCPGMLAVVGSGGWVVLLLLILVAAGLFGAVHFNKNPEAWERLTGWLTERKFKYKKLPVKPDAFSDDEFDLGEELLDDHDQDNGLQPFDDEGLSSFGPLPPPSSDFKETAVPALTPPPGVPILAPAPKDSRLHDDDLGDEMFNAS